MTIEELRSDPYQDILHQAGFRTENLSITFLLYEQPEAVTLSEIFLEVSDMKSAAKVEARANYVASVARAGSDFAKLAAENSDRNAKTGGAILDQDGKPKLFQISELPANIGAVINELPEGSLTGPIRVNDGFVILKVNRRKPYVSLDDLPRVKTSIGLKALQNLSVNESRSP